MGNLSESYVLQLTLSAVGCSSILWAITHGRFHQQSVHIITSNSITLVLGQSLGGSLHDPIYQFLYAGIGVCAVPLCPKAFLPLPEILVVLLHCQVLLYVTQAV